MAGLGGSWGSREEFLHPRDKHGRFRKSWRMAEGVIDAISKFLERFSPRTFQSDGQSAQYLFNRAKPSRFGGGTQYARLHADFDEANQHLRAGDIDAPTQKFVKMMDDSAVNIDSDIIVSQTVGPEAFGLTPETMNLEDGGIEDITGKLMADRGYSAGNIGTPLSHGPGKITIVKAVPKGTKVIIPARSQNDRGIFLDRDQELRITKVKSDGRGGYYALAVATPRTPGETPEPIDNAPRGVGLSPQEREARVRGVQGRQAKREGIRSDAEINAEAVQQGTQQVKQEQPQAPTPAPQQPAAPGEPPPRNEPILKESVGGADTQGKGTTEIAQTPVEQPPAPETPAAPVPNIREAVQAAGVPSPSAGPRRRQWNNAYLGVASGKKDPGDMLRELDRDIEHFKGLRKDNESTGTEDPNLDSDIDAMEQLADVISSEYNIPRTGPAGEKRRGPARIPEESRARLVQQRKELRAKAQPDSEQVKLEKARAELQAREAADRTNAKRKQEIEAENAADTELINRWLNEAGIDQSKLPDMDRVGLNVVAGSLRRGRISRAEAARRLRTDREGSRLNEIADLIEGQPIKAAKKAASSKVAPIGQAPGEKRRELPGEAGTRGVTSIKAFKATKQQEIQAKEERKRRLLSPEAPPVAPEKKAPAKKASVTSLAEARAQKLTPEQRREVSDLSPEEQNSYRGFRGKGMAHGDALQSARDAVGTRNARKAEQANKTLTKAAPTPVSTEALPETTPGSGKVRMSQLRSGVPVLVEQGPDGKWRPATKKTGATKITVQEVNQVTGRGGQRQVVGVDDQGNRVEVESRANVQTFFLGNVPAKKAVPKAAVPAKKAAPPPPGVKQVNVFSKDAIHPGISDEDYAELLRYSGGDFRKINTGLRNDETSPATDAIDRIMEDSQLTEDITLYRGLNTGTGIFGPREGWPDDFTGFEWTEKGYTSTSTEKELATDFARKGVTQQPGVFLRIKTPKGTHAIDLEGGLQEREMLLERGLRFRVTGEGEPRRVGISGNMARVLDVEIVPSGAPVKKAAKKAPAPVSATGPPDIDRMTVPELKKLAKDELVPLTGLTRKQQIKDAILRNRESGSGGVSTAGAEVVAGPGVLERIQADNAKTGPNATLISDLAKDIGIKGDAGGLIPARQLDFKQGMSLREVADRISRDADELEASPMPTAGTDKGVTRAEQKIRDDSVRQLRELAARLHARSAPPAEPNAPAAQKPIQAPDRREAFADDWLNTPSLANINEKTAAGRTINEVRDDVLKGKITPDEGIRRLENDIELNKADLAEAQRELRGDLPDDERETVSADVDKLRRAISDQENASSFMRKHFRKAPVVTPKEIEVQLDPEGAKLVQGASADEIRQAAKVSGFGELKGSNKDELLQDLVKKIAGKELEKRAAKKTAPKKLAPAPLVTKKSSDPDYVDARAIAEGLDMTEDDQRMLGLVQDWLDGKGERALTPAAAGRRLMNHANGAGGPAWERVVHHQVTLEGIQDRIAGKMPSGKTPEQLQQDLRKAEAKDAQLKAQAERWAALAERLQKTRRRPARKATEPAPEKPKLTPEEKKVTAQAADVLGVPKEQLQKQALAKKVAAAPAPEAAKSAVDTMRTMQSREEGQAFLKNRTKAELQAIAKAGDISYGSKDTKAKIADQIVQWTIGRRLDTEAISKPTPRRPDPDDPMGLRILARGGFRDKGNLENMSPAELADVETELGIKRTSLDRGDRIAAIRARQADQAKAATATRSLPASGRRWNWETIDQDNMTMHGDSASMNLAQKLRKAGREEDAQYVADMRYRISNDRGEHSPDDVEKMVSDLKKMMDAEQDPALKGAYRRALDDIEAPQSPAPELPKSTPPTLRKMMDELNQIPVARRTGHFAGTTKKVSAVDRLAELIQKIESGNGGSIGAVQSELRSILRSFHESVDGAFQMWRLESLIDEPDIKTWIRSFY